MLKLKLQYFVHLMQTDDSLEKSLGKIESRRRRGQQKVRWLGVTTNSMDMNLDKLWGMVRHRGVWYFAVHGSLRVGHDSATEQQQRHHTAAFDKS